LDAAAYKGAVDYTAALPKFLCENDRIEVSFSPPRRFISAPVEGAMMSAAEGNRVFVADPAAKRPRLHEPQVVGVGRPASANQARLH
jgi:hypothetical protein